MLGLCLFATATGWQLSVSQLRERAEIRFNHHVATVDHAITSRIQSYEQLLKGAGGLFAASQSVEHDEWQAYVQSLKIQERCQGITAMGFIAYVRPEQLPQFEASNRVNYARFAISPPGSRSAYALVQYVAPEQGNQGALGYDIATDAQRWETAELARDTGDAMLTRRLRLGPNSDGTPSILMLIPVYRHGPEPMDAPQRRAALEGWVYASFILDELIGALIESHDPEIDFEIFDAYPLGLPTLLYNTDNILQALQHFPCSKEETRALTILNRRWAVHFSTRADFDAATASAEPRLLIGGGICISFLLFGITRSLTSTRQRALALAEEMTEKLRTQERAVIASNNGIFIADAAQPSRPIIYANPAMEKITGYTAEELRGQGVGLLMREDTDQDDLRILQNAMEEGGECRVVLRCYRKDRTPFWNELSISPVRDSNGIVNYYVGITDDITERKHAEETLRATSAMRRAILDSAGYMVLSTSPSGLIEIFNAAAERMTGYKASEVIGRPTSVLINDWTELEQRAEALSAELGRPIDPDFEVFVAKARLGQADEHEWKYLRKDGTRIPILLSVTPVRDEHGVILGFMGIGSDITERKRAEAQLQQATHAAEAANRAKSEFLANMSHEIRTPMNAVIGMTELALGAELTREVRGYLSAARNSAADLLTIINDILDFSKIEAGKLELHPEPFGLREALGLTLKTFSLRAAEKELELTLRVQPDVPEALVGDAGRLRQIVNNLVGNALKFTDQGEVLVEAALAGAGTAYFSRRPRAASGPASCLLHLTVTDSGIGIPADKQQRIFEAFTQADASVTRKYGGTGLGLAICSQLCHLMDGEIWVESEPGQGSRFHFTAAFGLAPTQPSTATAPELARATVLVVDDNATNRRVLAEMLSGWRMYPVLAATAAEALAALETSAQEGSPARFVLLDAQLATAATTDEVDSAALARQIHERWDSAPAVILLQPSAAGPAEIERFRAAGVDTFLVKPVGQSELLNALLHCAGVPDAARGTPPTSEQPPAPSTRSLRVLLAEDNAVNRELATTILRKLGHAVVTVSNGQQALAAWERGGFDLILMDVQMPGMDGIEATTLIREREKATGQHVPIFGLTAHAMLGDREQGLSAGMDEYVTKPLRLDELVSAINRVANLPPASSPRAFRPDRLIRSLNGDQVALRRLVGIYLETTPPLLEKLRAAMEQNDAAGFQHAAHTLRGSLLQLDAAQESALAGELERRGREQNLREIQPKVAELEQRIHSLQESVRAWLQA